ncbi:MAG: DUF5674 family protein [Defluviitaleaceae bacterium]|nr:DUF5674 family protein [Defluviitaleaceae bacterium]
MLMTDAIKQADFSNCAHTNFGELMVKLVADLQKECLAYDAPWHADLEAELIEAGSAQADLWGFNYYFERDELEYNSLINIRPLENKSSDILNPEICAEVEKIFRKWVRGE